MRISDDLLHALWLIGMTTIIAIAVLTGGGCANFPDIDLSDFQPGAVTPPTPNPTPDAPPAPSPSVQIAVSWENNARYREMNLTAASLDEVRSRFAAAKARGCNTVNLYLVNLRDGSPVPSTIYSDVFGGAIDRDRVQHFMDISQLARVHGLVINWWSLADDGGGIPYRAARDAGAITKVINDYAAVLRDEILNGGGYVVIALEADENLTKDLVQTYAKAWKSALPGIKVANHMCSGEYSWSRSIPEVDCHFHQTEPGASVAAFAAEIKNVVAKAGKPVVACEFSLVGTDSTAQTKAQIALDAGCIGVHSGVPK